MNAFGFSAKEEVALTARTLDIVKSSEIEGEILNFEQVRSSIWIFRSKLPLIPVVSCHLTL